MKKEEIDESGNIEVNRLAKECLRVDYFFFIIDQARCWPQFRIEQFKQYKDTFIFIFFPNNLEGLKHATITGSLKSYGQLEH